MPAYLRPADADCPTYVDDTEWHPLVDGAAYFDELLAATEDLGDGDALLIGNLAVDPWLDLRGRAPGQPGYEAFGERLARAAAAGATVRVLLAGRVLASTLPVAGLGDFRKNALHAQELRSWQPAGHGGDPPLEGRVLVDFSGSLPGANHQKVVVVSRAGELTAFVGGIDLEPDRRDAAPHDTLRYRNARWGWHDAVVRLRGPGATRVWDVLARRWDEAATLPGKHFVRRPPRWEELNPGVAQPTPPSRPPQSPVTAAAGTQVQVLRSIPRHKFTSALPGRTIEWNALPRTGVHEIYETLSTAIGEARRYVYLEDQYLGEELGADHSYELYGRLRDAARRGVKVIMLGSGIRDPADPGIHLRQINRKLNRDLRRKVVDGLGAHRANVAVYRLEHCTVHAKLFLIDDAFACIGSANLFSRSMGGVDNELACAVQTTTSLVRDLRVRVWGEHLRAPSSPQLRGALEDLDTALGIWDTRWLPPLASSLTWRAPGTPPGYAPTETVLHRVD
ncbi:phospholipase D-like domain-containing protein [uncultured Jatrophihabitans sp.]|uniref:phospholipase D-like domain-containing protein n=1 Tax=uncultured Jatrophihabitans sp. TaxID=1610747 RepID=UPI0035C9A5A2